jgi:hypothetical protein
MAGRTCGHEQHNWLTAGKPPTARRNFLFVYFLSKMASEGVYKWGYCGKPTIFQHSLKFIIVTHKSPRYMELLAT